MSAELEERRKKLIAAFAAMDHRKTGKVPTSLVLKLTQCFATKFTDEERAEFEQEADSGGFIEYEAFVNNVLFGEVV